METVLRGRKTAEVIPFDYDAPVLYYPVRHHSPVCAWHLEQATERYKPELILVEGPENANDLIPILASPETEAPVALYYAYRDDAGLLNVAGQTEKQEKDGLPAESCACYYPLLDQSPELVALRLAERLKIPARFIDLPYGEILAATRSGTGLRKEETTVSYADDSFLVPELLWKNVCEKTGTRDFEEFWEKYYESRGLSLSTEEFVRQVNTWCLLARENTPRQEMEADGCLARESHMARRIREATRSYKKIMVVAGGFHILGLLRPENEQKDILNISKDSQTVYPVRYSEPAADALSGYASGMPAPAFYRKLWQQLHTDGTSTTEAWNSVVLDTIVRCGRRLRAKGEIISAYDEQCALQQAQGLATLRNKAAPGLYELQDSILSAFVKGEANLAGCKPLRLLREINTGNKVGRLCRSDLVPPLVQDFTRQCKKYRLRQNSADRQEVTLEIFSKTRHRAESRFLHQSVFLDCGYAKRDKGPDLLHGTGRNLIREHWICQWSAGVETALIEHAIWGATVAEACAQLLRRRLAEAPRAVNGAELLVQGFLMGLTDTANTMIHRLEELLLTDGDFSSLCGACGAISTLEAWQEQYHEKDSYDYNALLRQCFARILHMLPSMSSVDDRGVETIQEHCQLLYEITARPTFSDLRADFLATLEELIAQDPIHPALHGTALGLLYGGAPEKKNLAVQTAAGYLRGTHDQKLRAAAFLQGLFRTARDLLLVDDIQMASIDTLLCELEDEEFVNLLPQLRLAFSYFTPTETARLARQAATFHGKTRLKTEHYAVSPADYTCWESIDAWATQQLEQWKSLYTEKGDSLT